MALKLHKDYGYSYDNLKVLLGGWHAWVDASYPSVLATPAPKTAGSPQAAPGTTDQTPGPNVTPQP
ncbi:MAG TPA: hypothetical protein VM536_04165 [Chloroflexia bacterium]|nr:hypothetical protein [Chloroflexia bacterium]